MTKSPLKKRGNRKWKSFPSIRVASVPQIEDITRDEFGNEQEDTPLNPVIAHNGDDDDADTANDDKSVEPAGQNRAHNHQQHRFDCRSADDVTCRKNKLTLCDRYVNCDLYLEPERCDPPTEQSSAASSPTNIEEHADDVNIQKAEFDESLRILQFPTRFRVSEEQSLSQTQVSAESLAFALESTLKYTFHLLNEFAPEMVRRHVAVNVSAMRYGEYYRIILPNLQEVLAILRQLLK